MSTEPENQPQVRRPRLVVPGAGESVAPRPKIMLPGLGVMIDPSAPPAPPPPVELFQETPDDVPPVGDATSGDVEEAPLAAAADDETAEIAEEVADAPELEPEPPPAGEAEPPPIMEEFLGEPDTEPEAEAEIHEHVPRHRVPELRAAPADLKALVPRRLGPPAAAVVVPESGEDAAAGDEAATEPGEEPVVVAQAWEPTVVEYEGRWETTDAAPEAAGEPQEAEHEQEPEPEEQTYATGEAEAQEEEVPLVLAAPEPAPEVARKTASVRVPMPLTSPQGVARPPTRMVTQRVRGATGHPTQSMGGKTTQRPEQAPRSQSAPKPKAVAPVAPPAVPSWMLALIGFFVGVLATILLVTKSPMKGKIGLTSRTEAAEYTRQVLAEERAQIQAMLDDNHENDKIKLADDMRAYREESGKKAPESMNLKGKMR